LPEADEHVQVALADLVGGHDGDRGLLLAEQK
jgi:hypothetical protein